MKPKPHESPDCRCNACLDWHTVQMMHQSWSWLVNELARLIREDPQCQAEFKAFMDRETAEARKDRL